MQIQKFQRIIISVDNLNRQIWGSIYQFIKHLYDPEPELKNFGLDIYGTDTTTKIQYNLNNKIDIENTSIEFCKKHEIIIIYNKNEGHDEFGINVVHVDFDHIASFLMLEKKHSALMLEKNLYGKLVLGINLNNLDENDYKYRLAAFCSLSNNIPIRLLRPIINENNSNLNLKQFEEVIFKQTNDVSRPYLPLCKITESTYNQLFVKKIDDVKKTIDENEDEQKLIQYVIESIKKLEGDFNKYYLQEFNKRYTTLFDKWFILAYFYSIGAPYLDKRLKSETTSITKYTDDDIVAALKTYTNNIQELSQNIIRHVKDKKEGYLYVAFIKKEDISKNIIDLANIDAEVKRFVEFGIMDGANEGIVTTFKERPENKAEEIELINFFDLNPTKTLNLTGLDMRYAAHLGLKTFVASIRGQSGYFYVESSDSNVKSKVELCNGEIKEISCPNDFVDGTHFHVIVPVSKIKGLITSPKSHSSTTSFIEQYKAILDNGKRIRVSDTDLSNVLKLSSSTDIEERNNVIIKLGDKIAKEKYSIDEIKREIALEIPENDGSPYIVQNIYRLINYLQLSLNNNYFTTIVLTNLSDDFVAAFWELFKIHVIDAKLDPIWKDDCAIVLMSKNLNYRIISGETINDIVALNNEVGKHYCISTNNSLSGTATIKDELKYFVRPYELLIDNNKYFYSYVENLLKKCIEDNEQGYCVRHENTYIGSKMIVVNYYEAETLFQNSFFAERFAFLIAQKLKSENIKIGEDWYIVGDGYHSDLMIKFLLRLLSDKPKTMLAIDDGDDIKFHYLIKPNQQSKFVIISPIGSTLSYSDKIVAFLTQKFGVNNDKCVNHHCVIVVGNKNRYKNNNGNIHVFSKGDNNSMPDIEYTFRWESIDIQNKQINLRYKNVKKVNYDILIGQKDKKKDEDNWHHRIDEHITFPGNDYGSEKYVNLTENQSINSQNLLGLPKLHDIYLKSDKHESDKHENELKDLMEFIPHIYYGHIENHHTHYRYYINSEAFIAKEKLNNNSNFALWMSDLKKDSLFKNSDDCLNIIVTPNAKIESGFVNHINEKVFCNNAQIINIDAHSWKNNMAHKYKYIGDVVKNNVNVKFHYVDHALLTANTYLKTKSFLEEITASIKNNNSSEKNTETPAFFSSVIVLVNRVSPNLTDNIAINKNFRAFLNLFIPESTDNISDCLLCALEEFYVHFHEKTISLDCNNIIARNEFKIKKTTFEEIKNKNEKKPIDAKKRLRLLFTHELFYQLAQINDSKDNSCFDKYRLSKEMLDGFYDDDNMNGFCQKWFGKKIDPIDQKISFVKVISSPPLSRFIAVREYAHTKLLDILKEVLEKKIETCNLDDLKLLKAVLKSLSFLNSTALVRKEVILGSWRMYNSVFKAVDNDWFNSNETNLFSYAKSELDLFPKNLYFNIKKAILEDETKSMFLNELLRTGKECLTMDELKENVKRKAEFHVMCDEGLEFCEEVKHQYVHFLEWLYYDTTTVLQKALANFEKETIKDDDIKKSFYIDSKDDDIKKSFYIDSKDDDPKKWVLADYQQAVNNTIQNFRDKVLGDGNKVEYYYENLKLYNSNEEGIDYIDKLVRVLYAKLKLERLVDSEADNSQTKIETDITRLLTVLSDVMKTVRLFRSFIIFKHDEQHNKEQAYYEIAVGGYSRCGRVDEDGMEPFVKDFSLNEPFESGQKKIHGDEYYCEYTRIDEHSVLYFAYDSETKASSKAQKQLLLLLRNSLCEYVYFISKYGLVDVWVEEQQKQEYFKQRFRKNTHNAYENLQRISSNFFNDKQMTENPEYVNLYSIIADLHVGRIHNSILVKNEQKYSYRIQDYSIIKDRFEHFIECAKHFLKAEGITNVEVGNMNGKSFYYTDYLTFLLFQFIHNIKDKTANGFQADVKVRIYIEGDYLVISNTHAKIKISDFEHTKELLQSESEIEMPKKSISLYCINHFCKQMTGKNLIIDAEDNYSRFIVKIPIIKNN